MAGHSKFKNIQHRKGAQDKKRAKLFTKLVREIITSAKAGMPDPEHNPRLRSAIIAARAQNLPKDRIDKAIDASTGADAASYDEMRYEGFAPNGIAVIVEVLTDNKNRSAAEIRSAFNKAGGNLGETGSVSFMFNHVGLLEFSAEKISAETIFESALEAGAEDVQSNDDTHRIVTSVEQFAAVRDQLISELGDPLEANLTWLPTTPIEVTDAEQAEKLMKFIDVLEDNDDVQKVFTNFELSDEVAEKLAA